MSRVHPGAIVLAVVLGFLASGLWYGLLFADVYPRLAGLSDAGAMSPAQLVAQLGRDLVVAFVLARLIEKTGTTDRAGAIRLGLWVWLGFQAMAIAGSVIHERYPWQLYAIHTGDALLKTLLASAILGGWRRRASTAPAVGAAA
jgi:hypothetical protein